MLNSLTRIFEFGVVSAIRELRNGDLIGFAKDVRRVVRWTKEFLYHGFHSADLYGLDTTLAEFIAPRLRQFIVWFDVRSTPMGMSRESWRDKLNRMTTAFELLQKDDLWSYTEEERQSIQDGLRLFGKYFCDLWD